MSFAWGMWLDENARIGRIQASLIAKMVTPLPVLWSMELRTRQVKEVSTGLPPIKLFGSLDGLAWGHG